MNISEALRTGIGVTLPEALKFGGMTTLLGLVIVFAVLVVLMIVLYLFKVVFYKDPNKQKKNAAETAADNRATLTADTAANNTIAEDELIAVLTAAVAASLNTSTYNLRIKSYRRIEDKRPVWNKAGINETIGNRF